MAKEQVTGTTLLPAKIKTLDDLFFYRNYYGPIQKISFEYQNSFPTYTINAIGKKESEKMEMELIEKEHDIWISFTE